MSSAPSNPVNPDLALALALADAADEVADHGGDDDGFGEHALNPGLVAESQHHPALARLSRLRVEKRVEVWFAHIVESGEERPSRSGSGDLVQVGERFVGVPVPEEAGEYVHPVGGFVALCA